MEGGVGEVLLHILMGCILLMLPTAIPALALIRALDPGADLLRQILLFPAAALLAMMGLAGWLVVATGEHSVGLLIFALFVINLLAATLFWQKDVVRVRRLSAWERLEAIEELTDAEAGDDTTRVEADVAAERRHADLVATGRRAWLPFAMLGALIASLAPLLIFERPQGVDWLGFATLSHRLAESGNLALPAPSVGAWSYPPGFPATAALLEEVAGLAPADAVHLLGHLCLFAVLWGVAGAADRWGAAAETLLALALAPALFAKAFDSGYPTVASQLGLVLGLLVLVKPPRTRNRRVDLLFALGVAFVGVIHPTGSLYLGALLLAWMVCHRFSARRDDAHAARLALLSALVVGGGAFVVLGAFAPRMLENPVFAEYGWQGGTLMLLYNGLLVPLGVWCMWRWRASFEVWLLAAWALLLWSMTFVAFFHGLVGIGLLSLVAYMLYSMSMHGFHVVLAVLAGILLSHTPRLTARMIALDLSSAAEEGSMELPAPIDKPALTQSLAAFTCVALLLAFSVMGALTTHPETEVLTPGDRALRADIAQLPEGTLLYTETAHWGILEDAPPDLGLTSFPSLGLLRVESQLQWDVERAILRDDMTTLSELGLTHAATSPRGQLGHLLATSPHWNMIADHDGSRLWALNLLPDDPRASHFFFPDASTCTSGCEMRPDPWWHADPHHLGLRPDEILFLDEGEITFEIDIGEERRIRDQPLAVHLQYSAPTGAALTFTVCTEADGCEAKTFQSEGGARTTTIFVDAPSDDQLDIEVEVSQSGGTWVNPAGLSGRSDRILDSGGVWLHWVEVRTR